MEFDLFEEDGEAGVGCGELSVERYGRGWEGSGGGGRGEEGEEGIGQADEMV